MTRLLNRRWWLLLSTTAMIMLVPILTSFLQNRFEVSLQAMLLPLVLALLTATIVALIFWGLFQRRFLAGYLAAAAVAVILSTSFNDRLNSISGLISGLLPLPSLGSFNDLVIDLVFIGLILTGAYWLGRGLAVLVHRRKWPERDLVMGLFLAITTAFVIQLIPTAKTLIVAWPQYFYKPQRLSTTTATASSTNSKPDIYYIVLDRYASQSVLKSQFKFDNGDFLDYLRANGYQTNPNAHQNYPYTTMSIASTLSGNYLSDQINRFAGSSSQSIVPYHRTIKYSPIVQDLKSLGYQFHEIGTWYEATDQAPLADHFYLQDSKLTVFNHEFHLEGFSNSYLKDSVYAKLVNLNIKLGRFTILNLATQGQADMTKSALGTLNYLADQSSGGRFIFAHLLIPHDPYFFNSDGSLALNADSNNIGQPIKQKYLGQVQYINSQMKPLLDKIRRHSSGQAAVILQADEGPYPIQLNDQIFDQTQVSTEINDLDMNSWSDQDLAMKYGNLAAYYIPQASNADLTSGGDNLNIFRLVFNTYFGQHLSYLPQCIYAYPNGRQKPFLYSDVTKRLTGNSNPACQADGTGPR